MAADRREDSSGGPTGLDLQLQEMTRGQTRAMVASRVQNGLTGYRAVEPYSYTYSSNLLESSLLIA